MWLEPWHSPGAPSPLCQDVNLSCLFREETKVTYLSSKTLHFAKVVLQFLTKQKQTLNQSQALYLYGNFLALLL